MAPVIYAVIMSALGVFLIGVEVAIIPGIGLVGVIGGAAVLFGSYISYANYGMVWGVVTIATSTVVSVMGMYLAYKLGFVTRLVLHEQTTGESSDLAADGSGLLNQPGTAISDLRPAGVAKVNGQRTDVVAADGEYIEAGTPIVVVEIDQNSVIVTRQLEGE